MSSDSQRFQEALDTLLELGARVDQEIYKGHVGVLEWLASQPEGQREAAKRSVGSWLHLGRKRVGGQQVDELRKVLRALLLVQLTRFGLGRSGVASLKTVAASPNAAIARGQLLDQLRQLCRLIVMQPGRVIIREDVLEYAGRLGLPDPVHSLNRAQHEGAQILRDAVAYLRSGSDPRNLVASWFGQADRTELAGRLEKLLAAYNSKPLLVSLGTLADKLLEAFASAEPHSYEDFKKRAFIEFAVGQYFFTETGSHSSQVMSDIGVFADVFGADLKMREAREKLLQDTKMAMEQSPDRAYEIDKASDKLFEAIRKSIKQNESRMPPAPAGVELISVAGAILHEASHHVIGTDDVDLIDGKLAYGPNRCYWLAQNRPADAAKNADNIRIFCEQFLPNAPNLVR